LLLVVPGLGLPLPVRCQALTEQARRAFAVGFPESVDIRRVQVRYFLTGTFGGYGEYAFEQSGAHRILLHTESKGIPANSLKAILFAPGCQIVTAEVPDLGKSSGEMRFQCRSLPTVSFKGRIVSAAPVTNLQPVVEIEYVAFWSLGFFGIADGPAATFLIATVPLEPGLRFHLALPDFSMDPVTNSHQAAALRFTPVDAKSGNIIGTLTPPEASWPHGQVRIQPEYPTELTFVLHRQ
jgi:hypothetical protein